VQIAGLGILSTYTNNKKSVGIRKRSRRVLVDSDMSFNSR